MYVGDGDGLCGAVGPGRSNWVEGRLDLYVPELREPAGPAAKAALKRITARRQAVLVADQRVVLRCAIGWRSVGDLMRAAGVRDGNGRWGPNAIGSSAKDAYPCRCLTEGS